MKNYGCGYDSCPCRGVHFIAGGGLDADYCVDGKRVCLGSDSRVLTPSASEAQVVKLELWLLDEFARYLVWHHNTPYMRNEPLSAFSWSYPLTRYERNQSK
jgi:hypothetical protein